ncbi:MAG: SusC/RagA family TonB-linked outer membrane protein [Bacteroidota bacterium]
MRKTFLLTLFLCMSIVQLLAQTRTVKGTIRDESGKPVSSASIMVKGTKTGSMSNENGLFSIDVPLGGKSLVVSGIGLVSKDVVIPASNTVSVVMALSTNIIDEVVVTGYTRQKKANFGGAATVISAKVVETVPVGSFDQALQGRVPGMLVNSSSGQPGTSATVTIRGIQSISGAGAQPLYVLDGIPISAGDFQTLNPNDFETFTILKDANSTALYGARGGTGVIVITTKKGKAGKTKFTFRSQLGYTMAPDFSRLNMMNSSEILEYEERLGLILSPVAGNNPNNPGWIYSKKNPTYALATPEVQARRDFLLDSIRGIDTDLPDILYRRGLSQTHEINMSGGSEKSSFYLSAGYFNQEGIDLGSALKRYTTRFNLNHTEGKFSIQWNNSIGYSKTNYSEGEFLGNSPRNPFQMTYRAKPYENPFREDGSLIFGANTTLALKQVGNLLEGIENSSLTTDQMKINSGITTSYIIIPSITVRNTFGVDVTNDLNQRFVTAASYIGSLQTFQAGIDQESNRVGTQLINTTSAVYSKRFKDLHDLEVGAYFEVIRGYQKAIGFTAYNLDPRLSLTAQNAGPLPTNLATTVPQYGNSAKSGYGFRSYFAIGSYTYNGKYNISGNVRRDGTSRIANENNEITTWSGAVKWNAIKEGFMKAQNILTDLSLKASYGVVPNMGSIPTSTYGLPGTTVTNFLGPQVPSYAATSYAGSTLAGQAPSSPGNPTLNIEYIQKTNIGLEFAVWKNKARFSIDAYKNTTIDLFVNQPLSATTGFASTNINAGKMSNKGLEALVSVDVIQTRDFGVMVGWNHSMNINKIEDLGLVNEYPSGTFIIRKGLAYGSHYTFNYLGADPATGKPTYETLDGKTTNELAQAGRFAKFGTYLPKHVGGFNAEIRYKGFTVAALFSYQFDVVRSNNIRNWITRGTSGYQASVNGSKELLTNQWMKAGDVALFQSPAFDRDFTSSDLENARFLRFRNLNVSYQVPLIKIGGTTIIKGAKLYGQMQNVAVWSPWTGLDPEDGNNISLNEYPNPTMVVAGIDINF